MARKSFFSAVSSALGREARRLGDQTLITAIADVMESTGEFGFRRDLFVRHAMFETSGQTHTVYVVVDDEGTAEWTLDPVEALSIAARCPFGFAAYSYQSLLPLNQDDEAITDEVVNLLEQHDENSKTPTLVLIAGPSASIAGATLGDSFYGDDDCQCDCGACGAGHCPHCQSEEPCDV